MNIKQAQELELSADEKGLRDNLKNSKEWLFTKALLERWVLKLNANTLVGTEVEKGAAEEEFRDLRAFTRRWRRFVQLIETKDE